MDAATPSQHKGSDATQENLLGTQDFGGAVRGTEEHGGSVPSQSQARDAALQECDLGTGSAEFPGRLRRCR